MFDHTCLLISIIRISSILELFDFIIPRLYNNYSDLLHMLYYIPLQLQLYMETNNSSSKTRGAAAPRTRITCAYFLGSEEPSLKLSRLAKLQRTNSSPNSNCRRSKSAIFISRNINSDINSLLRLRVGTHIIYIYISILYLSDERYIPEVEMRRQPLKIYTQCILVD